MTVRALVIDDSVVVRRTVATVLDGAEDIEVVGTASDGRLGLRRIAELRPDVVTLDVEMPGMSGLETLAEVRREWPTLPVIMYSTLTERGAVATLDALSLGAVDYATKPSGATSREDAARQVQDNLLPLVRLWGKTRVGVRPTTRRMGNPHAAGAVATPTAPAARNTGPVQVITMGVSTGGPDALAALVPLLPPLPVPLLIVQHMPPVFTAMLAQRLDRLCDHPVTEAQDGEPALPGHIYIAPGGQHLQVDRIGTGLRLVLDDGPPENSCRPAVDVLFRSAAAAAPGGVLAAVLTGMGQDGLLGAEVICASGGTVLVQDEDTSVVWGMPGYVARAGLAAAIVPLAGIADELSVRLAGAQAVARAVQPCP